MDLNFFLPDLEPETGIFFHTENLLFELNDTLKIQDWLSKIIEQEGHQLSLLSFILCDDDYLHKINVKYLDHDTLTDIITFPLAELPTVEGEIYISIPRVRENASKFKTTFENELHRVLAHGVLHLCGYFDKTDAEAKLMRQKEGEALNLFKNIHI
ncbi:MAG: putative rRNA maturation factor [Paraglaciecola sp.]|jgi:probable rRNA maturation factor